GKQQRKDLPVATRSVTAAPEQLPQLAPKDTTRRLVRHECTCLSALESCHESLGLRRRPGAIDPLDDDEAPGKRTGVLARQCHERHPRASGAGSTPRITLSMRRVVPTRTATKAPVLPGSSWPCNTGCRSTE